MAQTLICDCSSAGSVLIQITTLIVVIIGWYVINRHNNKREKRREVRTQLDSFISLVSDIEKNSVKYHIEQDHNEEIARTIKRNIGALRKFAIRLNLLDTNILNRSNINLNRAITMKNFDNGENHIPESENGELIAGIYSVCDDFVEAMESGYNKIYK